MYIGEDSIQDKASIIRILKLNLQTPFDHEFDDIQDNDEKSFETIKQKLEAKRVAIEQKFVEAEKAYETFLADQKILHRASLAKKDENIRKTMDFLHTIGFDLLPQNATNALLAQLNAKT